MNKQEIRTQVWTLLEEKDMVDFPRPCFGRIPNFKGSRIASQKIKQIPEFKSAKCVFCAPDAVLKRIREIVLEKGKVLAVALPHIEGLVEIRERDALYHATTIKGFKKYGKPLETKIDLFVQGSVAVDRFGNRLGKGKGYGDREYQILKSRGLLKDNVKVVTLVHEFQVVDDLRKLMNDKDIKVDYIITNSGIIFTH